MYKKVIILLILILFQSCSKHGLPSSFTDQELSETLSKTTFRYYGQYLDIGTKEVNSGKVLIKKESNHFYVAFYKAEKNNFILIDKPIKFEQTKNPHASAYNDVASIQAIKLNGKEKQVAYVKEGKVQTETVKINQP